MLKQRGELFRYRLIVTICLMALGWLILTLWVEREGPARIWHTPVNDAAKKVLIVFDPDPIYNLDEQVCLAFAKGLSTHRIDAVVATVTAVSDSSLNSYDAFVICANTYNWRPDWAITNFIEHESVIASKPVAAITVGSGSTSAAQQALEKIISDHGGNLRSSNTFWLMRPNDEEEQDADNVEVATSLAFHAGEHFADRLY